MANLFFSGEKASKEEARTGLMELIADNWTDAFTVDFWSDGGGRRATLKVSSKVYGMAPRSA
jgi:hypothetical protein